MWASLRALQPMLVAIALLAAACAAPPPVALTLPGEGTEIRMARADWSTGYFQAEVVRLMLEELGYSVTDLGNNELAPASFYLGLGNGDYDLWVNGWLPSHNSFLAEPLLDGATVESEVTTIGSIVASGAFQGFLTDAATADKYNIQYFEDIADNPSIAALYDIDGDGAADITGCNVGWGCNAAIDELIQANGWEDTLTQTVDDFDALFAATVASFEAGESILTYIWAPSGYFAQLVPGEDVVWLGFRNEQAAGSQVVPFPPQQCPGQPCDLGLPLNSVVAVLNNNFLADNPAAGALVEVSSLPLTDVAVQNLRMILGEDSEADLRRHAKEWIAENRVVVDSWLDYARGAAR